MRTLQTLKKEAEESARFRGHALGKWESCNHKQFGINTCTKCGALVIVDTSPLPNGIDIGGTAVAIHCTGAKPE